MEDVELVEVSSKIIALLFITVAVEASKKIIHKFGSERTNNWKSLLQTHALWTHSERGGMHASLCGRTSNLKRT